MSRLRISGLIVSASAVVAAALLVPAPAQCCPFCGPPTLTFAEQYAKADAVVLAQWAGGEAPSKSSLGSTTWEVVQAPKAPFPWLEKGKKITLERYREGKKGDLALLMGNRSKGELVEWSVPLDITLAVFNYIVHAPPLDAPAARRLTYCLEFLENADPTIAADAFSEFANAPYKDILPLSKKFPREKLRKWLTTSETQISRRALYGLMLGLCGNDADAGLMQEMIVETSDDYRLGIEGVMGGYLLLTGETGLETIEKSKLQDRKALFSETYAAMQALRFMWTYGNGRIPTDRLRKSMEMLLDRPELADLVVSDLARWKDWTVQKRLMELYGSEEYNVPSIKRAIIRYMIASTKDIPAGGGEKAPQHAVDAAKCLEQLRERDPKLVADAEKYFFLQ